MGFAPRRVAQAVAVALGLGATEGVGLLLLIPMLQLVGVGAEQGTLGAVVNVFSAAFAAAGLRPTLGAMLLLYVACVGTQGLLQRWSVELAQRLRRDVITAIRARSYRAIVGMTWTAFARTRQSDHMQVLTHEVERVGSAAHLLVDLLVTAGTSAAYVGLALRVSPAMTMLVLACGALLAAAARVPMATARREGQRYTAASSRFYAAIAEHLSGLKLARSHGGEQRHAEAFAKLSAELGDVETETIRSHSRLRHHLSLASSAMLAAIVYASHVVLRVPTAELLLLLFLFGRLIPRLTNLSERAQLLATLLPSYEAVRDAERRCLAEAEPPVERHAPIALGDRIELEHVGFDYRGGSGVAALDDVNLTLQAGTTIAVVGPSGSGKSTLADLLMGLITPSRGRLLIDGTPLDKTMLPSWRASIGYVPQETWLLHDSVRANLARARPDATERQMWRALDMAAASDFVRALPEGLDTVVGDRGVLISGGERQRLSLARALLREPKILILDEATSALDAENEERVRQAIGRLHREMTIVLITHRIAAIRDADVVHVLERGRVVESGTWQSLSARSSSRFRELCEAQEVHVPVIH